MSTCKRVLIVDDEPNIRALLEAILDISDFETYSVDSAEQALSTLNIKPFDIVITDHEMGGMDGSQLARIIKSQCPNIFVIGVSGNQRSSKFLDAGADFFLSKPIDFNELFSIIEKYKETSS